MRLLSRIFFLLAMFGNLWAADESAPPPMLPENLTLTSKVVLHKISAVRWEKDRVIIHHLGGTDPILYKYIADPQRAVMLALRDIEMSKPKMQPKTAAAAPAAAPEGVFSGQCYVATSGGSLAYYRMSGMTVMVLPPEAEERFKDDNATINLPPALLLVTTDMDGKFTFTVPPKTPFFLLAQGYHLENNQKVYYHWRMQSTAIKDPVHLLLTRDNCTHVNKRLVFDHM